MLVSLFSSNIPLYIGKNPVEKLCKVLEMELKMYTPVSIKLVFEKIKFKVLHYIQLDVKIRLACSKALLLTTSSSNIITNSKTGLTLNDLYDTTCMTHRQFSHFHCVYTIIHVVHTEFIKVVLTEYSAFKSSSKMIQKQAAAAVIITLISKKNKSRKKRKKEESVQNLGLKEEKTEFYETSIAELWLDNEPRL